MKATELIEKLQAAVEEHGDLEVVNTAGSFYGPVQELEVSEFCEDPDSSHEMMPVDYYPSPRAHSYRNAIDIR